MTFGDKIRSMSNGELAEFLHRILNCDDCDFGDCKSCLFGAAFVLLMVKRGRLQEKLW